MKTSKVLPILNWVVGGAMAALVLSRYAQKARTSLPAPALAQALPPAQPYRSQGGAPGVADQRGVARFSDLEQQPPPNVQPLAIPLMPIPGDLPVPYGLSFPAGAPQWEGALPSPLSPTPVASFLALGDDNTRIPPDTMGAVGPNHLMTTLNSQVRIQDKSGNVISTVSLQTFWASMGPFNTGTGAFDPRASYDPYGKRWIHAAVSDPRDPRSSVLIAVSQTADPTGMWNFYRVDVERPRLHLDAQHLGKLPQRVRGRFCPSAWLLA